jgi:MinD superfamily P-loop ATPase
MKEIVIISGKGGTGKTSVAAALAFVAGKVIMADCDVDAADLHLILKPDILEREDFYSGVKAEIKIDKCTSCGLCEQVCRFNAISHKQDFYKVDPLDCEGCGYCYHVCPVNAIILPEQKVGECYVSQTRIDCKLVHAKLGIGADNSGKLVARVKKKAKQRAELDNLDFILVDGSPGIGCPVISSLSGADFALLVTEPTLSGLSDLKRVWQLAKKFNIPGGCIINKADLNPVLTNQTEEFLKAEGLLHIDNLPYDEDFHQAITLGKSLVEYNPAKWHPTFNKIWNIIMKEII